MGNTVSPAEQLELWLSEDFPEVSAQILPLMLDSSGRPLMFGHIALMGPHIELNRSIPTEALSDIHCAYVYLSSYYFCLDAVVDGHSRGDNSSLSGARVALYLSHLMAGSVIRFQRALEGHAAAYSYFREQFCNLIARNALAVQTEGRFRAEIFEPRVHEEFESIVGRANTFIFLFDLFGAITGSPLHPAARSQLEKFVYFEQLGDDLGDWRQDFRAIHYTSFLRTCFGELRKIPSEDELEEFVYLSGVYEERLICVIRGFDEIVRHPATSAHLASAFSDFVEQERARAVCSLEDFVSEKLRGGVRYGRYR